jgi:DNA-binding CsgD family transcriptional regulator
MPAGEVAGTSAADASAHWSGMFGRVAEREALDLLLEGARRGQGGAVVLRGEPGIGTTALLEYARASADGMQLLNAPGVEAEQALAYGNLHRLLEPVLGGATELSQRRQDSLSSTFGGNGHVTLDGFSAADAALALLTRTAAARPVLCIVDDAEWLDASSDQALAFIARRISAEPIAMAFAAREAAEPQLRLQGLPELAVTGLSDEDSRSLLSATTGDISKGVMDSLLTATRGNPLALAGVVAALSGPQLSGVLELPDPLPLGERIEAAFIRRIRRLPEGTQRLLLLIATERVGDEDLIWRVAEELGIGPEDAGPAEAEGLLAPGSHPELRHPFVGFTVYSTAPISERRRIHRALAAALEESPDPDRRAWHLAAATSGLDEAVAAQLEETAERARHRSGYEAMAAALERAAQLSPDPSRRSDRLLSAAWAELVAGNPGRAAALLDDARTGQPDERRAAKVKTLGAALDMARGEDSQVSTALLQAAQALEPLDVALARDTHLVAFEAALYAHHLGPLGTLGAARAARRAPRIPDSKMRAADFLLDGYGALFTEGRAAGIPSLRRAIDILLERGGLRWLGLACLGCWELWDEAAMQALAQRRVRLARHDRALTVLPNGLSQLGAYEVIVGRFDAAEARFDESRRAFAWTGNPGVIGSTDPGGMMLAVWRGQERRARAVAEACKREATARGQGAFVNLADCHLAVLELSFGNYDAALTAARAAREDNPLWSGNRALPELIEAAARTRSLDEGEAAAEELAETANASGTHWGLGMLARSRALLAPDAEADGFYRVAIDHLKRCRATPDLARAHLIYGEWLRRRRRRLDAREQLKIAHQMFASMGARAFAERAQREVLATGERARPAAATMAALTPRETKIAELVSRGGTNAEIAAQLFVSPRTIEYHLHKIFRKLGISSRTQLTASLLPSSSQ